ncbi:hypothetical protein AVEN_5681-1 [Araneus ventricosus]|uniref:Secreted protein n=1 Tax=Araneus ventricosus TaxID=182803 RepID=A0A4Y2DWX6_ARAVE|nr:hypothetical protein AVEN_5681-1 [Araneus ventricosus]
MNALIQFIFSLHLTCYLGHWRDWMVVETVPDQRVTDLRSDSVKIRYEFTHSIHIQSSSNVLSGTLDRLADGRDCSRLEGLRFEIRFSQRSVMNALIQFIFSLHLTCYLGHWRDCSRPESHRFEI